MITLLSYFQHMIISMCLLLTSSCTPAYTGTVINLAGATPADELIRTMLTIPAESEVDFIQWDLKLYDNHSFVLNIIFGASQPNTLGFKSNAEKRTAKGTFTVSESSNFKTIYHLQSSSLPAGISLAKLSENLFHLLTPQQQLIPGNGGWSYSLNRKDIVSKNEILISSAVTDASPLQLVFDGRTPCQEIAAEHPEMNASPACFKLKWRLILNRDSITFLPTTYIIRKVVDNVVRDSVPGKWTIIKGTAGNPAAVIYQLDPDKPEESISFLAGDDNVLFFLNKKNEPYIGNEHHSYTMNRRFQ